MLDTLARIVDYRQRISRNPLIMGGETCIAGTRYPTELCRETVTSFPSKLVGIEWMLREHPLLNRWDVLAALWYEGLPHRRFGRWWDAHGYTVVSNRELD